MLKIIKNAYYRFPNPEFPIPTKQLLKPCIMTFRTILQPTPATFSIQREHQICCIGSCFTENIGKKLIENKFSTYINSFGIVYNPISIAKQLTTLSDEKFIFEEKNCIEHGGVWHSFEHHSSFSMLTKENLLENIHIEWQKARNFLQKTNVLILTLGTAFTYEYLPTGEIVANCHQLPNQQFSKKMRSVAEVVASLSPVLQELKHQNRDLQVILTVSPVRHLSDGMVENQRSKSVLLLAAAELEAQLGFATYFPAYEIVMDDLRDYRFFEADMLHPNEVAIGYIWAFFEQTFFKKSTLQINQQITNLRKARAHRPFQASSEGYLAFVKQQLTTIETLTKKYEWLDFEEEKAFFDAFLRKND
jgi:GSCFA family